MSDHPASASSSAKPRGAAERLTFTVDESVAGKHLDRALSLRFSASSKNYLKNLIRLGFVRVNDERAASSGQLLNPGDVVSVEFSEPPDTRPDAAAGPAAQAPPLEVLYEDEEIIVVSKPAGQVVHPAPGAWSGTLVDALCAHFEAHRGKRAAKKQDVAAGIVHRLDRETSGVVIAGKTAAMRGALTAQLRTRRVEKTYVAVVEGVPRAAGLSEVLVSRPLKQGRRVRVCGEDEEGAMPAVTAYRVLASNAEQNRSVLLVRLETGRTHQIRVHLASEGLPIVGDRLYGPSAAGRDRGGEGEGGGRHALHAWRVALRHPFRGHEVSAEAPLPEELARLCASVDPACLARLQPQPPGPAPAP
eukprot:tig00000144_g9123.t1